MLIFNKTNISSGKVKIDWEKISNCDNHIGPNISLDKIEKVSGSWGAWFNFTPNVPDRVMSEIEHSFLCLDNWFLDLNEIESAAKDGGPNKIVYTQAINLIKRKCNHAEYNNTMTS